VPQTGGVVFGIRLALHRLNHLAGDPALAAGLARALANMPEAPAAYKGLAAVRRPLLQKLSMS